MFVWAVRRACEPESRQFAISSADETVTSLRPDREMLPFFSSFTVISFFGGGTT